MNNPQPLAVITREPLPSVLHQDAILHAGMPTKFPHRKERGAWYSLPEYWEIWDYHHYCKGRIAIQYCSFQVKRDGHGSQEWMAFHDTRHSGSLQELCDAAAHHL